MKKYILSLGALAAFLPMLARAEEAVAAANTAVAAGEGNGLKTVGAALAIALPGVGAALGISRAAASGLEGIARNPGAAKEVQGSLLLSLVFMELIALLGFAMAFLLK